MYAIPQRFEAKEPLSPILLCDLTIALFFGDALIYPSPATASTSFAHSFINNKTMTYEPLLSDKFYVFVQTKQN
jgi:hypothetical protein